MKNKLRFLAHSLKFNRSDLLEGLLIGVLFSAFIYLEHFGIHWAWLNSLLALYAFYRLLGASQGTMVVSGFVIGVLWFYWVGFSFRFVGMGWMIPLIALVFSLGYTFIFWLIGFSTHVFVRALLLFLLIFYRPLAFNWFRPELGFVHSYFGIQLWQFALILAALALFIYLKKHAWRPAVLLLLIGALNYAQPEPNVLPIDVQISHTELDQNSKWEESERSKIIHMNLRLIYQAIEDKKDLIILPESAFPAYLNQWPELIDLLKNLSQKIAIITGSLLYEDQLPYNATYYFNKGEVVVAKKMILVPFGEYIPLPKFLRNFINKTFFKDGTDFKTASAPTDFEVGEVKLRNAICYEATYELFYEGDVKFIVATSNNAWFAPSIEPTLQRLLITLYAKRHHVTVLHSANGSKSEQIAY